ncbi:hypothetical protein T11_11799 [Trichinella zimbabwensis]|uniref:Uncharacterized protein n=1 Tax=Trichinella zimbabwensis TaxID=268475 RepID=A0A0V1GWQ0_9BILA|nr:hypothetical protein T11_11799 [Trichinella zimbabwensis]
MTPARLLERQSRRTSELANETLTTPSNNAAMIDNVLIPACDSSIFFDRSQLGKVCTGNQRPSQDIGMLDLNSGIPASGTKIRCEPSDSDQQARAKVVLTERYTGKRVKNGIFQRQEEEQRCSIHQPGCNSGAQADSPR